MSEVTATVSVVPSREEMFEQVAMSLKLSEQLALVEDTHTPHPDAVKIFGMPSFGSVRWLIDQGMDCLVFDYLLMLTAGCSPKERVMLLALLFR